MSVKPKRKQITVEIINDYQFKYGRNLYTKVSYQKIIPVFAIPQKHLFCKLNTLFAFPEDMLLCDLKDKIDKKLYKPDRLFNLLYRNGIYSLEELGVYSIERLILIKGMGKQLVDLLYQILCELFQPEYLLTESDTDEEHY
jgi:hypothetical protein